MFKPDGNASCSRKKNILGAIRQFSCPELPKPIKVQDESNFGRVFNQETQNPIRAVRNRCFAAFYRRETAT
jgi:hypothetical protein